MSVVAGIRGICECGGGCKACVCELGGGCKACVSVDV